MVYWGWGWSLALENEVHSKNGQIVGGSVPSAIAITVAHCGVDEPHGACTIDFVVNQSLCSSCKTRMQAHAQLCPSPPPRTRRGFWPTSITPPLPSTPPLATQETLPARAETAAVANERDQQYMRSVMHGTREAGALTAVRTSTNTTQLSLASL